MRCSGRKRARDFPWRERQCPRVATQLRSDAEGRVRPYCSECGEKAQSTVRLTQDEEKMWHLLES